MRHQRELGQAVDPVALVLLGAQVLGLHAQGGLRRELVFGVSYEDVAVYHASLAFYDGLVVALVHVHQVQAELFRQSARERDVQVLVVSLVAPLEEAAGVALGAGERHVALGERCHVGSALEFPVYGTHVAVVQLHIHAILSAQCCLALEVIAQLSLIGPLAVGQLCGVGVEGGQGVGLVLCEGRQVVDGAADAEHGASALERHVLRALGLQQQAEPLLRVAGREHGSAAAAVDVSVGLCGVVALLGVFGQQAQVAGVQLCAHVPCVHIFGLCYAVGGVAVACVGGASHGGRLQILLVLVLVHPRCSHHQSCAALLHGGHPLVDVQLGVGTGHMALVPVPVAALASAQCLQRHAGGGLQQQASAQERVVDAQCALLIGAQDESRAELLVEGSQGELGHVSALLALAHHALQVEVGHAPALEVALEAGQRMLQVLQPGAGLKQAVLQLQVYVGVGQQVVVLRGTYLLVALRYQYVTLNAAAQCEFVVTLGRSIQCQQAC